MNHQPSSMLFRDDGQPKPTQVVAVGSLKATHKGNAGTNPRKPRILVVDDEVTVADTLKMILDSSGYGARVAHSGEAAIERLRDFQPDMLITDIIMPRSMELRPLFRCLPYSPPAKSCSFLEMSTQRASLKRRATRTRNSMCLPNPFTQPICLQRCTAP
jgi:CheY-like chemotaxis protein